MFPYNDPYTMLDLHKQHVEELARQVRRDPSPVRRYGRWPRRSKSPARAAVAA
ncbi:hypothetical protein KOI35_44925 [Actinoplanes bogorensis]|uniref:Uncharacterized protein n=1 Tax=Paractinoplanes bogorensis TaxID=1610840 RepID=A0ABS5Z4X1_9ACTN|nr:hypothetical protein [Actinoplanes bogorensis]MBU2670667.1 hypothetical protein [Actinoplanes bogorensis]